MEANNNEEFAMIDYSLQANAVLNGELNALSTYIALKRQQMALGSALDAIKDLATDEANKYPEKTFKAFGATIEKKSGASRWDYSGVEEWIKAKERIKQIETISQVGGMDESGNEIQKAFKVSGPSTIAISF